jgi:WD40 repeat protein
MNALGSTKEVRESGSSVTDIDPVLAAAWSELQSQRPLTRVHVRDQPAVLAFLVDMLQGLHIATSMDPPHAGATSDANTLQAVVQGLHAVVRASSTVSDTGLCIAAANCASLLAQAGVSLRGARWYGVSLRRAVLSDAVMCSASLRGADLRGCKMERVCASMADFTGACLEGAALGQYPRMEHAHVGGTLSACFSPNGTAVVSGGADARVRLWDVDSAEELWCTVGGHVGPVRCVQFSSDGKLVVSGGDDGTVRVWDSDTGTAVGVLDGHAGCVRFVEFSRDGSAIASCSDDGTVRLWRASIEGGSAQLWDASIAQLCCCWSGHEGPVSCVRLSTNGTHLVSCGSDGSVRVWDAADTAGPGTEIGKHSKPATAVCFLPGDRQVASCCEGGIVLVSDVAGGSSLEKFRVTWELHALRSLALSPDGRAMVLGGDDDTVCVVSMATNKPCAELDGHHGAISSVCFSADGARITSAGKDDCSVRVWAFEAAALDSTSALPGHDGGVCSVSLSHADDCIVSSGVDGAVRVWDVDTGACVAVLQKMVQEDVSPAPVVFAGAGIKQDRNVVVSVSEDGRVCKWDMLTGTCTVSKTLKAGQRPVRVTSAVLSANRTRLVIGADDALVHVWDVAAFACVSQLDGHQGQVTAVACSSWGAIASGGADGAVRVWDESTDAGPGGEWHSSVLDCETTALTLCYDAGTRLAACTAGGTVRVWDTAGPASGWHRVWVQPWRGGVVPATRSLAFIAGTVMLACGGEDGTVRVWNCESGGAVEIKAAHRDVVHGLACTSDGLLVSCSQDGSIAGWRQFEGRASEWSQQLLLSKPRVKLLTFKGAQCRDTKARLSTSVVLRQHGAMDGWAQADGVTGAGEVMASTEDISQWVMHRVDGCSDGRPQERGSRRKTVAGEAGASASSAVVPTVSLRCGVCTTVETCIDCFPCCMVRTALPWTSWTCLQRQRLQPPRHPFAQLLSSQYAERPLKKLCRMTANHTRCSGASNHVAAVRDDDESRAATRVGHPCCMNCVYECPLQMPVPIARRRGGGPMETQKTTATQVTMARPTGSGVCTCTRSPYEVQGA